ncbi:MAG: 4-hydroxythreonine-4-phosphate dehydrogenase PdxA [Nitrospirae bacterium]|nr:MAG: 4-hydroxythreonine-4-phosphate dehydrogenase PdxA [Nitrospirota bacterium]
MKKIAITMGEPSGVGPEVIVKALSIKEIREKCIPIVVGDDSIMEEAIELIGSSLKIKNIEELEEAKEVEDILWLIEPSPLKDYTKKGPTKESGEAVYSYIKKAVKMAMDGSVDAIVTAPISKESLSLAGLPWRGHTEMLAEMTSTDEYAMMFVGGPLKVILVTIHIPLRDVPMSITKKEVLKTIKLAYRASKMFGINRPRIGVAGLNPHAGESGLLGSEEKEEIEPAILEAKEYGIDVKGPYPPDVIFYRAYHGDLDIVCAMYHDQGLIPFKMIAFEKGVNITIGLPIIRTSPDHGTAQDIAWKGIANPSSMAEAIRIAVTLSN